MRILLTGLSGAGKSEAGNAWAKLRGVPFVDLDREVEERLGMSVKEIFATQGERAFRAAERLCLAQASEIEDAVIALGAGALGGEGALEIAQALGKIVWLAISPEAAAARLGAAADRPLLAGQGTQSKLAKQLSERRRTYAEAGIVIDARGTPAEVAARGQAALAKAQAVTLVQSHRGAYAVRTARFDEHELGALLRAHAARLIVICDEAVLDRASRIAEAAGAPLISVAAGERLKRLDAIETLIVELQEVGADRHTAVAAIGGGSLTDAVGFVAAVYMRGIEWLSVPSTLLGMIDSGLGGKVGANAGHTKNALGAFYPPLSVIADLTWLDTLPERDRRSGAAEMLKVFATHDAESFARLASGDAPNDWSHIARAAAIKAEVVSRDEFEQGERKVLNFGHTFGHAFESVAGLADLRHGEAIALGMLAETAFAVEHGVARPETLAALASACSTLGLPEDWRAFTVGAGAFLAHDKKRVGAHIRLPIVPDIGRHIWADMTLESMSEFLQRQGVAP